jgi:hypothetical protein
MIREIIMRPESMNDHLLIDHVAFNYEHLHNLVAHVDKYLLFLGEEHFTALTGAYPNGYRKTGTIRFKQGHIRLPFGVLLPVYETAEFNKRAPPRGIASINYVVACHLRDITEDEWLRDGFNSQEELLEGMKRYYAELSLDSIVSYYKFKWYNPNPSPKELERLLKIMR